MLNNNGSRKNHPQKVLALPLEVKVRDLDPRLYFGLKACEKGYTVVIGGKSAVNEIATSIPTFYMCKGATIRHIPFYKSIKTTGGVIFRMDEEGGVYGKDEEESLLFRFSESLMRSVDKVALWGEDQLSIFKNTYQDSSLFNKMVVTGHPRFDLRKKQFECVYKGLGEGVRPAKYILVNSTFGAGNSFHGAEYDLKFLEKNCDFDIDQFRAFYAHQKEVLVLFVQMVNSLARKNPDIDIIYRPHPHENLDYYKDVFKEANITINQEGSVQEWIVGAECVIHCDCTTAIEAFLFGKPVFSYMPKYDERYIQDMPPRVSIVAKDTEGIEQLVAAVLDDDPQALDTEDERNAKKDLLKGTIANVNFFATEAILAELDKLHVEPFTGSWEFCREKPSQRLKESLKKLRIKMGLKSVSESDALANSKFPGVSKGDIDKRIALFQEADPSIPNIKVERLKESCFKLRVDTDVPA